jgi:hypothetical protein
MAHHRKKGQLQKADPLYTTDARGVNEAAAHSARHHRTSIPDCAAKR